MAYFTRTHEYRKLGGHAEPNGVPRLILHDDCMPAELFETHQHSAGPFKHQVYPWCWCPDSMYGFVRCYACGAPIITDDHYIGLEIAYVENITPGGFGCNGVMTDEAKAEKLADLYGQLADVTMPHLLTI